MPTWLIGAYRAGLQIVWAYLVAAAAGRGWTLPADAPAWIDEALFAATLAGFVGVIQWLETRDDDTTLGHAARLLARWLMLGARPADYPREPQELPGTRYPTRG